MTATPRAELQRRYRDNLRDGLVSVCTERLPAGPLLRQFRGVVLEESSPVRRVLARAKLHGYVSVSVADEVCVRALGMHPVEVYGDAWYLP